MVSLSHPSRSFYGSDHGCVSALPQRRCCLESGKSKWSFSIYWALRPAKASCCTAWMSLLTSLQTASAPLDLLRTTTPRFASVPGTRKTRYLNHMCYVMIARWWARQRADVWNSTLSQTKQTWQLVLFRAYLFISLWGFFLRRDFINPITFPFSFRSKMAAGTSHISSSTLRTAVSYL